VIFFHIASFLNKGVSLTLINLKRCVCANAYEGKLRFKVCKIDYWNKLHSLIYFDENDKQKNLPRGSQLVSYNFNPDEKEKVWFYNDNGVLRKVLYKYIDYISAYPP
jgi:hypothetical protein